MSLLSVTVKKARYVAMQATQFNTYVTLKLQNVKSTTVTVKGPAPCWEQDFLFETNDINSGLLVEVWNKGVIWDRALGYHWLPLTTVAYANEDCGGRWVELEAQLVMRGGAVVGTAGVTGHALLLDCRFELPFDAEGAGAEAAAELQRKLDLLNGALDAERAEQARRQMQYVAHSGYSEDSDYTSDLNYPVGQHPNCSASQFRNAALHSMHTPQRSLEVSRENSYERDEYQLHSDADPLYYNSRPRNTRNDWTYQGDLQAQASVESAVSWRTAADWTSGDEPRRPSLERQNTLYDDLGYSYDAYSSTNIGEHPHFSQQASYEEYFDSSSYPLHGSGYAAGDERRQWDGGGLSVLQQQQYEDEYYEQLAAVQKSSKRRSSVVQLPQIPNTKYDAASFRYSDYNGMEPYRPRQRRTAASLPVTPSSTPRAGRALPLPPSAGSGTGSVGRSRRLPRVPHAPAAAAAAPAAHANRNNRRVPYNLSVSLKTLPARNYSLDDGYEYQPQNNQQQDYQQTDNQHLDYQDANNYNSSYQDDDGMQPFFNETPHATPPALQKITNWTESNTTTPTTARAAVNYRFKFPTATQDATTFPPSAAASAPCLPGVPAAAPLAAGLPAGQPAPAPQPAHPDAAATVLAGAQSLGLLAAGGAKKFSGMFGSLFSAPAVSSAPTSLNLDASSQFAPAKVEPPLISSRPGATLPRAPSLRRQESLQRPPVQRLRSLPNAPDDDYYPEPPTEEYEQRPDETDHSHIEKKEEEFFDPDYAKTESRRASPEVLHRKASQEALARSSPARSVAVNGFGSRKPSVDSYGSVAAERRTSAQLPVPEFHREDAKPPLPQVPTAEAEPIIDKNGRASAQERTSYHEEKTSYHEEEQYHDDKQYSEEHEHYAEEAEEFHEEAEKFDREHDEFREGEETYGEFQEPKPTPQAVFEEEQPKLTPRQLWHRAYNKIIRQLNIDVNNVDNPPFASP